MRDFLNSILDQDKALFSLINGKWTHPVLDTIMPWLRQSNNWVLLYVAIVVFLFIKWGVKTWKWLVIAVLNVTITDQVSSSIFKPLFARLRPCQDPAILHKSRLLIEHCSSGFSFTSSHAANHFGFAMFVFMTLSPLFKNYTYLFFIWAGCISYAQIYIGVHYPLDILGGTLLGISIGYLSSKLFEKWVQAAKKQS
jgi:undecaprenyl-diphosphatase